MNDDEFIFILANYKRIYIKSLALNVPSPALSIYLFCKLSNNNNNNNILRKETGWSFKPFYFRRFELTL